MKVKLDPLFFTAIAVMLIFASCAKNKSETPTPSLSLSSTAAIAFTTAAEASEYKTITVTTNQSSWDAESDQAWCKVDKNIAAKTFTVSAQPNTSTEAPTPGKVTVTAGDATPVVIDVTQAAALLPAADESAMEGITGPGTIPAGITSYAGAFWKKDQTGERVINIAAGGNSGPWSAVVAWYDSNWDPAGGDGVVLKLGDSADPNIRKSGTKPGDAKDYQVDGKLASVSGSLDVNHPILFRIGLTKPFAAYDANSKPARYAVIVLSYNNGAAKQKIFLRQGEGDDFVMRAGDKSSSGATVADGRPLAKKFSPYNITDPERNETNNWNSMTNSGNGIVNKNGGRPVDYPSQGGYFFFGNRYFFAFHPNYPTISNWPASGALTSWDGTSETCPTGYRRPTDGSATNTAGLVAGSEIRQSLWQDPQAGTASDMKNSLWGHYADGYFDREYSSGGIASRDSKNVAYIGMLFFNPTTNSSLFFPAAGSRQPANGWSLNLGSEGYYWQGTNYDAANVWQLSFRNNHAKQASYGSLGAASVRCVRAE